MLIGNTDVEDALQRLNDLTEEEARIAYAELCRTTHSLCEGALRKWLSPPDPSTNHNNLWKTHLKGTTDWFTCGTVFKDWKSAGSLLWVHGNRGFLLAFSMRSVLTIFNLIAGSGKSVLWFVLSFFFRLVGLKWFCSSAIIEDLMSLRESGNASVAYFYCDFRDDDKQSCRNLLHSLIVQLSARSESRCDILTDLYNSHDRGLREPSNCAITECLKNMLTVLSHNPTYIILDALDECPNTSGILSPRKQVLDLVKELVGLPLPNLYICVSSRPEVDIRDVLQPLALHQVSLHDENGQRQAIIDYITHVVDSDENMQKWRKEDRDLVIKTLSAKADGM